MKSKRNSQKLISKKNWITISIVFIVILIVFLGLIYSRYNCVEKYVSPLYKFSFNYDQCYFGKAIITEGGCDTPKMFVEYITFKKSPLQMYLNQRCGIVFDEDHTPFVKYQEIAKSGQPFDVYLHSGDKSFGIDASYRNQEHSVEISSGKSYTDKETLENKINTIINTMNVNFDIASYNSTRIK